MEKYDGAGVDAADEFVEGFFPAWLCVLLPVDVCQAPEDGGVPGLAGQIQALDAVFALGRAKIRVQRLAGDLLVSGGDAVQFFFKPAGSVMADMSGWCSVWFPAVWPSSAIRFARSGAERRKSPVRKKAAGTYFFLLRCPGFWRYFRFHTRSQR